MKFWSTPGSPYAIAAKLFVLAMFAIPQSARAGGFTPCDQPFIFEHVAANIVPIEYLATSLDADSGDAERVGEMQETARQLAWLTKLDAWHQQTFGSLGVVAHMYLGEKCDPDVTLTRFIEGRGVQVEPGQILIMLNGHVFIDGDQVFLQSRIRGFRRNNTEFSDDNSISSYFEREGLFISLDDYPLRGTLPLLDVTFEPRMLSLADIQEIDRRFVDASVVYREREVSDDGEKLQFRPDEQHAFSVQILDDGQWLRIEDSIGGISGYIRANPGASARLHVSLPELDFLNGLLGYLRVSQAYNNADFAPPPEKAASYARESFGRYLAQENSAYDIEARALTRAMSGVLTAAIDQKWYEARQDFASAVAHAPHRTNYRNLMGLADSMLCCSGQAAAEYNDPARSFTDSLSVNPDDREALLNLDSFLAFLVRLSNSSKPLPDGIDTSRLAERKAVVGKIVASVAEE